MLLRDGTLSCVLIGLTLVVGCELKDAAASPSSQNTGPESATQYAVSLTVATVANLPTCNAVLDGTVARVDSPPSLWACTGLAWKEIKCTKDNLGQVAYANASSSLFACVSKQWMLVPLPAGPQGPRGPVGPQSEPGEDGDDGEQGPAGPQGEPGEDGEEGPQGDPGEDGEDGEEGPAGPGARIVLTSVTSIDGCEAGAVRVDVGTDDDADATLDAAEIEQTAYLCNGFVAEDAGTAGAGGSAAEDAGVTPMDGDCAAAEQNRSYIGCEYWPVDLDNALEVFGPEPIEVGCEIFAPSAELQSIPVCWDPSGMTSEGVCDYDNDCSASPGTTCQTQSVCVLDAQTSPFAVVVSNPDPTEAVMVTLTNAVGTSQTVSVAPGAVESIFPQTLGFADQSVNDSGIHPNAYKLTSTKPIVAYQFNNLENVGMFSNDASLLLPRHAYDTSYYTMTYPTVTRRPQTNDYSGYVTIVASGTGSTMVTVTPRAAVRAGLNVPAIPVGATQVFTLNQFDVLNLEAQSGDLTGTAITASQPVGVFGGHEATWLSQMSSTPCCADHLEDQVFPASTWGMTYGVPKTATRTPAVADLVRILAQRPSTVVSFSPGAGSCPVLQAGDFCDVFINADVEVTSSEPILVGHYLASNGGNAGDPAMSFVPPSEQFRLDYTFAVPSQYRKNYVSLVARAGGTVVLDGSIVTGQLTTFGSGTFKAGRISVAAGPHKLHCPTGCGVEVYGWSDAVSYHYAGGLDLEQIVAD